MHISLKFMIGQLVTYIYSPPSFHKGIDQRPFGFTCDGELFGVFYWWADWRALFVLSIKERDRAGECMEIGFRLHHTCQPKHTHMLVLHHACSQISDSDQSRTSYVPHQECWGNVFMSFGRLFFLSFVSFEIP